MEESFKIQLLAQHCQVPQHHIHQSYTPEMVTPPLLWTVPVPETTFSNEIFPTIQPKLPLAQVEAISSHPTVCSLGEQTDPTSLQPPLR